VVVMPRNYQPQRSWNAVARAAQVARFMVRTCRADVTGPVDVPQRRP
jgi:hypothetical protein